MSPENGRLCTESELLQFGKRIIIRNPVIQICLQFQNLQIICKAGRENIGGIEGFEKKVVLISATPLNNKPDDIYNLISLFQDIRNSNLAVTNLQKFFYPHTQKYKVLIQQTPLDLKAIHDIFENIRDLVIKDITIRRTRTDLFKNERYNKT